MSINMSDYSPYRVYYVIFWDSIYPFGCKKLNAIYKRTPASRIGLNIKQLIVKTGGFISPQKNGTAFCCPVLPLLCFLVFLSVRFRGGGKKCAAAFAVAFDKALCGVLAHGKIFAQAVHTHKFRRSAADELFMESYFVVCKAFRTLDTVRKQIHYFSSLPMNIRESCFSSSIMKNSFLTPMSSPVIASTRRSP